MLTDGRTDGRTTDGRTTDAGVTGILIAHLGAFGSGELKTTNNIFFCLKIFFTFTNNVDPDEMPYYTGISSGSSLFCGSSMF